MSITQDQFNKLSKWMADKNIRLTCAACGHTGFAPNDIVSMPVVRAGKITNEAALMLQMVCQNCAHTLHFGAKPMGLA
jgi:predicted nucleic-acid-binding Zn-ribbon protein